jgi:hypothetical protein
MGDGGDVVDAVEEGRSLHLGHEGSAVVAPAGVQAAEVVDVVIVQQVGRWFGHETSLLDGRFLSLYPSLPDRPGGRTCSG